MNLDEPKLTLTAAFERAPEEVYNLLDALTQVMEYHRQAARKNLGPGAVREEVQFAAS